MKVYVGIDPGKTGAVAILHYPTEVAFYGPEDLEANPDLMAFVEVFVCIEKAQAMPGQGVVSMFNYGVSYGKLLGILKSDCLPFAEVRPATWKKEFSLIHQPKERSIEVAKQLFPFVADRLTRVKDHGRAEALLIAEYARRKNM